MKLNTPNIFFCSDPHYNHKNICEGVTDWPKGGDKTRKFETLEDMNSTIIKNINNKVFRTDHLFCLGDWSFGGFDAIKEFRDAVKCENVYLILGNHDHHIERNKNKIQDLFKWVGPYLELEVDYPSSHPIFGVNRYNFSMFHYPITTWNNMRKGSIHLFGHVHLSNEYKLRGGKAMDVGFDGNPKFEPYSLHEIATIMKDQPIKNISIPQEHDHH